MSVGVGARRAVVLYRDMFLGVGVRGQYGKVQRDTIGNPSWAGYCRIHARTRDIRLLDLRRCSPPFGLGVTSEDHSCVR
jgi:hypothetical protein